jgi:hypothetical protein
MVSLWIQNVESENAYCCIPLPSSGCGLTLEIVTSWKTEEGRSHFLKGLTTKIFRYNKRRDTKHCTSAISTRIPFARFLNVGGNKENMAKLIVCPDAEAPSKVTVKRFVRALAEVLGVKVTMTCFHAVCWPERTTVAEAMT